MGSPPPAAFQTRTTASVELETRCLLSGLHASQFTVPSCPLRTCAAPEPSAFQIRTVLSYEDDARRLPEGLHATAVTVPAWPSSTVRATPVSSARLARLDQPGGGE